MTYCLLALILLFSIITRFFEINLIPPLFFPTVVNLRILSALFNIFLIPLVYIYSKRISRSNKIALISSWVLATLPWVMEQGRIFSQPGNALFIFLLFLLLFNMSGSKLYKIGITLIFIPLFHLIYPQFWIFRTAALISPHNNYLDNLFILLSPNMFFFKNNTDWWVGVKDIGMVWITYTPFIPIGVFEIFIYRQYLIILPLVIISILSIMSPFFPESKEFYLAVPFIAMIIGSGIKTICSKKYSIVLISLFVLFLIYEMSQFIHNYYIHYPQNINSNRSKITQPF